jgi:hypothetical protein
MLWSASARAALIPTAVKTATPLAPAAVTQINTVVNGQAANLATATAPNLPNPTMLLQARKNLIDDADSPGNGATQAYQSQYAKSVIAALAPILSIKDPNQQNQRLNAAIVLGDVARQVSRTQVADLFDATAQTMLKDKSWPIVFWGLKISRYALANAVQNKNAKAVGLAQDIVTAVEAHPDSAEIIEEGYQALTLEPLRTPTSPDLPNFNAGMAITLPRVLDLFEWRTPLFQAGLPTAPAAENAPANMLPANAYGIISADPKIQTRTLKAIGALTATQLTAIKDALANGSLDPELVTAVKGLGNAINAFGVKMGDQNILQAGSQISQLGSSPASSTVDSAIAALHTAIP